MGGKESGKVSSGISLKGPREGVFKGARLRWRRGGVKRPAALFPCSALSWSGGSRFSGSLSFLSPSV